MRSNSEIQKIGAVIDFLDNKAETPGNIRTLNAMLQGLERLIYTVNRAEFEQSNINLAGAIFLVRADKFKPQFLNCVLQIAPGLLTQEYYLSTEHQAVRNIGKGRYSAADIRRNTPKNVRLLTPLRMAVKNRSIAMVIAVLEHPAFLEAMRDNVEVICDQLFSTYMYALRWYDKTAPGSDAARQMVRQLRESGQTALAEALEVNQNRILDLLLNSCKQAMGIARDQNKHLLPKSLMKVFIFDGMAGDKFTKHGKTNLINLQLQMMLEICRSYYGSEDELTEAKASGLYPNPHAIIHLMSLQLLIAKQETAKMVAKFLELFGKILEELDPVLLHEFLNIEGMADNIYTGWGKALMPFSGYISFNKKPQFLACMQGFECQLSLQSDLKSHVRNKDLRILAVANASFSDLMNQNIEVVCDRLIRSYMWALAWYHKDVTANRTYSSPEELFAAQKGFALNITTAQEKIILQVLSSACKKAMTIAAKQGKKEWCLKEIDVLHLSGLTSDGFLQHANFALMQYQQAELGKIFKVFDEQEAEQSKAAAISELNVLSPTTTTTTTIPPLASSSSTTSTSLVNTYIPTDCIKAVIAVACVLLIQHSIGGNAR